MSIPERALFGIRENHIGRPPELISADAIGDAEKNEYPMNRIIDIRDLDDQIEVTTTDVHLPRRIGKAIQGAWGGRLDIHFDEEGYITKIIWQRDT